MSKAARILVVGPSAPLAECLIPKFAALGSSFILVSHDEEEFDEHLLEGCKFMKHETIDVLDLSEWKDLMKTVQNELGGLDYLLYFDTVYHENTANNLSNIKDSRIIMETNFNGPVLAIQAALPILNESKGQIALLMSASEGAGVPQTSLYTASKNALQAYATVLNFKQENVGITCIYPGQIIEHSLHSDSTDITIPEKLPDLVIESLEYKQSRCVLATRERANTIKLMSDGTSTNGSIPAPPPIRLIPLDSSSPMIKCILSNDRVQYKELIRNAKPNELKAILERDENGRNAFHFSAFLGQLDLVTAMLKFGKSKLLKAKDKFGWTALHFASFGGNLRCTKRLLDDNADPNRLTNSGLSGLHFLARFDPGEDPKIINRYHVTLKRFLHFGADVNQRDVNWVTPLHEAAVHKSLPGLQFFIENEGDIHRQTKHTKETPLDYAMVPNNRNIVKLLLEHGADPVSCFDKAPADELSLLEKYRDANRRPDPDFEISEQPPVYVDCIDDLPDDAIKLYKKSGLDKELVESHWIEFIGVLRFLLHKRFKPTPKEKKKRRRRRKKVDGKKDSLIASKNHLKRARTVSKLASEEDTSSNDTPRKRLKRARTKVKIEEDEENGTKSPRKKLKRARTKVKIEDDEENGTKSPRHKRKDLDGMKSPRTKSPRPKSPRSKSPRSKSPKPKSPRPKSPRSKSPRTQKDGKSPRKSPREDMKSPRKKEDIDGVKSPRKLSKLRTTDIALEEKLTRSRADHDMTLEEMSEKFVSNGNPSKLFKLAEQVGRGGFGSVFSAKKDHTTVAIKKLSHLTEKQQWSNLDEVYFLNTFNHRNIVPIYETYLYRDELWISMQFLAGGSLAEVVKLDRFEEGHICYIIKQILKGLKYIHSKGYIHRDLKSANVMLGINADVFIIDFGLCCHSSKQKRGPVGSPYWMPPEMLNHTLQTTAADIWSLGILALEMANCEPPNHGSPLTAMFKTAIGEIPTFRKANRWSEEFHTFMKRLLVIEPSERATAEELLKDPWMSNTLPRKGMETLFQHIFVQSTLETLLV